MFKVKQTNNQGYCEVGQVNPLRWKTLLRDADGDFTDQSGWVKCKDFYNDTVAYFKAGSVFSIYSYKNDIKKNAEGVYFLLKYIANKDTFKANIEVVNKQLRADLKCEIPVYDYQNDEVVILIPNELWESTYRISMITMVIRLCNYGVLYKTWADIWNTSAPCQQQDKVFTKKAIQNALTMGFKVPQKYAKYWYFCSEEYNSEKNRNATGGIIHNNGCCSWSEGMAV